MNKLKILPVCICLIFAMVSCGRGSDNGIKTRLKTVRIGDQVWMAENLSVSSFRNGDTIPEAISAEEWVRFGSQGLPAWCIMQNNPENGKKYGKLYNWYAVSDPRGLAPRGWHVASDDEWTTLTDILGGQTASGFILRMSDAEVKKRNGGEVGFSSLPAGTRGSNGGFFGMGSYACWWTSTSITETNAWARALDYLKVEITPLSIHKYSGLSVRCVKD